MIKLLKQVFSQGDFIDLAISFPQEKEAVIEASASLIGVEKVEFTIQSLLGKKGFHPTWSFLLPSKHLKEETEFLTQTQVIEKSQFLLETRIKLEVPENAIPSYYGANCKVEYRVLLDIMLESGKRYQESQRILIDSSYKRSDKIVELEYDHGGLSLKTLEPLLIGSENLISISTYNLMEISPVRFVLARREVVKASNVIIESDLTELPLGQIEFSQNLSDIPIKFQIPSDYQHNYKGLLSRVEYTIRIYQILTKRRFLTSSESLKLLGEFPISIEYPIREQTIK